MNQTSFVIKITSAGTNPRRQNPEPKLCCCLSTVEHIGHIKECNIIASSLHDAADSITIPVEELTISKIQSKGFLVPRIQNTLLNWTHG